MGYQVDRRVYEPAEDSRLLCATLEKAVVRFPELRGCVLELGTGSGIVALMLASLGATVTATDLNPHAVALARSNAREQDLTIEFLQGDLFEPVGDRRFDAIVCNPPYLPPGGDYDDRWLALAVEGGPSGIEFTQRLLVDAPRNLHPKGGVWLVFSSLAGRLPAGWERERFDTQDFEDENLCVERLSHPTIDI
ncbi:MAG: methyltransferase [Candidatus Poseidoniia archaeon]|jgi:release factor glutamine methyltransferase|nr:methyltransferase [Candidatus Poseidoniia archaeon]MDP7255411.1 methyltransferase [Candidatus Poseidoniia archaeon]MDP7473404.1 methyltransferase [Candidatus Poseidoniia archaeon]MDP7589107.1 methyltransferase [Candidatus Poseidoniia archaeon]HJO28027.1 HemK2/MTQ2 family protein methyltransferase [Candidatus Poseidoniia archaeon]|tara:strand:+ start:2260 stop:2838 length:579 start_codon:yes stop_codon:yes gene_type:complete